MPWVHIEDVVAVFLLALEDNSFNGVYNLAAPELVKNKAFTKTYLKALKAPSLVPSAPSYALKILYGEMSQILLDSLPVQPEALLKQGYEFKFPKLEAALIQSLKK